MTNAHSPDSQPQPGIGRIEIPMPESLRDEPDEGPLVMHDDLRELVVDTVASFRAVKVLGLMLRGDVPPDLDTAGRYGLGVLLESVENRLALVVDGMVVMAVALGLDEARELV